MIMGMMESLVSFIMICVNVLISVVWNAIERIVLTELNIVVKDSVNVFIWLIVCVVTIIVSSMLRI